jgi:hypothetical protein
VDEGLPPIPINPGGVVDPRNLVGRDDDAALVMRALERGGGIVLTGERRHGKSSLARLVEQRCREHGWTVVARSLEGMKTVDAVSGGLAADLVDALPRMKQVAAWLRSRADFSVGGVSIDSAPVGLEEILGEACEHTQRLVLILDELPICARALERGQTGAGLAFLHSLRRLRQENAKLTMLCLGSIGFHHVLPNLEGSLNDIDKHPLNPLAIAGAEELAARLLASTSMPPAVGARLARPMALASEGVPYYLHHLADDCRRLDARGRSLGPSATEELVKAAIESPDDPWDLKHYVTRLPDYYGQDATSAAAILDLLATSPSTLGALRQGLSAGSAAIASMDVAGIVGRLEQDHYLVKRDGELRFRSDIVRRSWLRWRT